MKQVSVAQINDLSNGQMKQISIGDSQILLTKINDKFYATGAFCSHYGAPLEQGILSGEKIICPWHNACFNLISGQQENPPGLNSLSSFPTHIEGDQVYVQLPDEISQHRTLAMGKYQPTSDDRTFVVLGAGAAGANAVETLRQKDFQGKIILISAEEKLPSDRTKLSKNYLQGKVEENALPLRSCQFYDHYDIELRFGKTVTKVDALTQTIVFEDHSTLNYDLLLLATGGKPRKLDISGADLEHIFTLRQTEDVNHILETIKNKNAQKVLIIGSSFIGMEAAASLRQQGLAVTVVSPSDVPFEKILGTKLGKMFQTVHEEKGVTFKLETKVTEFMGNDRVQSVRLDNGEILETDLVIVGIGVEPNTRYLEGIKLNDNDHSIAVNQYLQTEIQDIYAAGDIASFPYAVMGKSIRIEHWRLAAQHGRIAAENMVASHDKLRTVDTLVPFFWSGQYHLKLRYVGYVEQWDKVIIDGDLAEPKFLAFYVQNKQIMSVAGMNHDQDIAAISELMRLQKMPDETIIKNGSVNWPNLL